MLTLLKNGAVIDPANGTHQISDVWIRDDRIVAAPDATERINTTIDYTGCTIMSGAIDLHTHIGGGKVNLARLLMAEDHRAHQHAATSLLRGGNSGCSPSTLVTGYRYAEMGYTACFEPAVLPINARQAHMEMADTPMVDRGGYAMLGNDDFFLRMLMAKRDQKAINDYVAWTLHATQCIGIKVVNPGGISAFKFNQRKLDVDEAHVHYGVTPRDIVRTLAQALHDLQVPHPLHIHASNLGIAGNVDSTLATIAASEGRPIHLTHIQYHSYGKEGDRKFSSAAARIAEAINANKHVTADVGQIMFGQTVTTSGDSQAQIRGAAFGNPKHSVIMDIECDAGCGVVPFKYKDTSFVNALQWAIGLEIFLLVNDPWRIFLTTDHPNGGPFTSYPHLIRLLMDKTYRNENLAKLNVEAQAMTTLGSITREYTIDEIAIMTRAAPARILGLRDRGHLAAGAAADVVVYRNNTDQQAMFAKPMAVFKDGVHTVQDGVIQRVVPGNLHTVKPEFDRGIETELRKWFADTQTLSIDSFKIGGDEVLSYCSCAEHNTSKLFTHECKRGNFYGASQ
jgi:formylmethanofuran dehydrogenase subunit A